MAERISTKLVLTHGQAEAGTIRPARIRCGSRSTAIGAELCARGRHGGRAGGRQAVREGPAPSPTEATYLRIAAGGCRGQRRPGRVERSTWRPRRAGRGRNRPRALRAPDGQAGQGQDDAGRARSSRRSEATKKAPLVPARSGSWSTYYPVSAHNGFAANIRSPRTGSTVRRPTRRALRLLDGDRRGELPDGLPPRRGDRRRPLGRGQGAGRWHLCHLDHALQRRGSSRPADRGRDHRTGTTSRATRSAWMPRSRGRSRCASATTRSTRSSIKAFASPGTVRFEIWSVPNGRTVSWSRPQRQQRRGGL